MSMVRLGLMVLALGALLAGQSFAQNNQSVPVPQEDPLHLLYGKDGRSFFRSKTARQLMSNNNYEIYKEALAALDCDSANKVLNRAFISQYPQFGRARQIPGCRRDLDCRKWARYAYVNFLEYGYCTITVLWREAELDIRQSNVTLPIFKLKRWPETTDYSNYRNENRDRVLAMLIGRAQASHPPALIKLAGLVRRGDLFNVGEDVEYYILQRACLVGDDCAAITPRLTELRKILMPDQIAAIDRQTRARADLRPILHLLLLGEKTLD